MSFYHKNKHKENPTKKTIVLTKARPGINQSYMWICTCKVDTWTGRNDICVDPPPRSSATAESPKYKD